MVKSPNKVITSGTAPTTTNTSKGDLAFGTVNGETKLYGNTGTEVVELGGGGGNDVNVIAPLTATTSPTATGDHSLAIGSGADSGLNAIAIGDDATANYGSNLVAIGYNSDAANSSVAIGSNTLAYGNSVAIGNSANADADHNVAIGAGAVCSGISTVAIGYNSRSDENSTFAVGSSDFTRRITHVSDPTGDQDAATKNYVDAKIAEIPSGTTINSIAPLTVTTAPSSSSPNAVAIGLNARATASSSVAIGANAVANASNTVSFGSSSGTRRIIYVTDPANAQDAATKNYVDTQLEPINTKLQHFPETFADTGWMEITGSSGNGLKYLTGPWTIPVAAKVKIRKFGKRVTVVGVVQATEDISSGAATPLLSIPESDPHFDAFNLPQVSQYDIAHDQQKSAVTSAILVHGVLTSFNVEQNPDTPSINVTLVPVVGTSGLTAQIENGDTVNFQISWDTED